MELVLGPNMKAHCGVSLRAVQHCHYDLIYAWKNDLANAHLFLGDGKFLSRKAFYKELAKLVKRSPLAAMVFDDRTDTPIGFAYAYGTNERRTGCSIAIYVVASYRYRGVGPVAFGLLARCLFFYHNYEKIKVSIAGWNALSKKTVENCGFFRAGRYREKELRLGSEVFPFIHLAMFREDYLLLAASPIWMRSIGPHSSTQ